MDPNMRSVASSSAWLLPGATFLHASILQGMFFGNKNHSAPMKPTKDMGNFAKTLNYLSSLEISELSAMCHEDFTKTNKCCSDLSSAQRTTTLGEGLLDTAHEHRGDKTGRRVCQCSFKTHMKDPAAVHSPSSNDCEFSDVPIPLFSRTRTGIVRGQRRRCAVV